MLLVLALFTLFLLTLGLGLYFMTVGENGLVGILSIACAGMLAICVGPAIHDAQHQATADAIAIHVAQCDSVDLSETVNLNTETTLSVVVRDGIVTSYGCAREK